MSLELKLKDFTFGVPAAERDENLVEYFVQQESFVRLRDGQKTIALGNRGSGKTAIFRMIAEHMRQKGARVIELSPEDYSYELLSESMLGESQGSWAKQSAYIAAWKYILYVLMMKRVTENAKRSKGSPEETIYKYLRDNHNNIEKDPINHLISYLKRIESLKIGKYEASVKTKELQKLYKLEDIEYLLEPLNEALSKREVVVLVDELDRGWDSSNDAKDFVSGLFHAAQSINEHVPSCRILLSLRKELYNSIPSLYEDAQKVRDIIEVIEWDEDSLFDLITKRIGAFTSDTERADKQLLWSSVFAETLDYRQTKSFNYLIDRTLYRPREIIQFCNNVRDKAVAEEYEPPLDYKAISDAELPYSEARVQDIASEYRFEYPGLGYIFDTFRGLPYSFDRDGLEWHCLRIVEGDLNVGEAAGWCRELDPSRLVEILWHVGFLRAQTVGGLKARRRSGSSYLGSHQINSLSLVNLHRFHVHHMFRTYLGMKEGTYQPE